MWIPIAIKDWDMEKQITDREDGLISGIGEHRSKPSLADLRGQGLAKLLRDQGRALQMPRSGNTFSVGRTDGKGAVIGGTGP